MKKLLKMASYAVLPLAALMMFSSYSGGSGDNPCPPAGTDHGYTVLLPVPDDCTAFYACSNGVPVLHYCPDGQHFNDRLDTCDWPKDAGCDPSVEEGGRNRRIAVQIMFPNGPVGCCKFTNDPSHNCSGLIDCERFRQ